MKITVVTGSRADYGLLGTGVKVLQPGEAEMQKIARGRWCSPTG